MKQTEAVQPGIRDNKTSTSLNVRNAINVPVSVLNSPKDTVEYPMALPAGTHILQVHELFKKPVGFVFVISQDNKTFLAEITRGEHAHSERLLDETCDITIRYGNKVMSRLMTIPYIFSRASVFARHQKKNANFGNLNK